LRVSGYETRKEYALDSQVFRRSWRIAAHKKRSGNPLEGGRGSKKIVSQQPEGLPHFTR